MNTTPDPEIVREIAEEVANIALHDAVHVDQWISAVVNGRFGNECSQFRAPLHIAVARRMAVVKPSWPDEQPQDDGDVRAVARLKAADVPGDLVRIAANAIHAFYAAHPENEPEDDAIRVLLAATLDARDAKGGGEQ